MIKITMPQAGQSMEEGTIVRWHKSEGQSVAKGDIFFEIETDKATIEVEAAESGVLHKILCPVGKTVPILTPIAIVGGAKENVAGAIAEAEAELKAILSGGAPAAAPAGPASEPIAASPAPSPAALSVKPILMPQAGQSMEEGTLVKWRVKPGDTIKKGDIIFEVETDKSVVEVEAIEDGRLARIIVAEGQTVPVLQPVAFLAESDAEVDAFLAASAAPATAPANGAQAASKEPVPARTATVSPAPAVRSESGRVKASPAARKQAGERGIDLSSVGAGSGPGGRILSTDVPQAGASVSIPGEPVRRRMSPMRKAIARNLLASKQNIPHWYIQRIIDASPMMDFYRGEKANYPCSVNDVLTLACARVIREFPAFRSRVDGDEVIEFPSANIGVAVGLDDGLVVPVVLGVDRLSLRQLGVESKRVAELARKGKIENMGQGIFTISNLGMFGVDQFTAIINPPEAAILAVSAVREEVIVKNGAMRPGKTLSLTLSADHRLIDGMLAAKFMARLKEVLEAPAQFLL